VVVVKYDEIAGRAARFVRQIIFCVEFNARRVSCGIELSSRA